jgi:hypothetical protein
VGSIAPGSGSGPDFGTAGDAVGGSPVFVVVVVATGISVAGSVVSDAGSAESSLVSTVRPADAGFVDWGVGGSTVDTAVSVRGSAVSSLVDTCVPLAGSAVQAATGFSDVAASSVGSVAPEIGLGFVVVAAAAGLVAAGSAVCAAGSAVSSPACTARPGVVGFAA